MLHESTQKQTNRRIRAEKEILRKLPCTDTIPNTSEQSKILLPAHEQVPWTFGSLIQAIK